MMGGQSRSSFVSISIAVSLAMFALTMSVEIFHGIEQSMALYSESTCTGHAFVVKENIPDLRTYNLGYKVKSALAIGSWLMYGAANYNSDARNNKASSTSFTNSHNCVDLTSLAGSLYSLRFVGEKANLSADSITLYSLDDYQGVQKYITSDAKYVTPPIRVKSIIITGNHPWTIYSESAFKGTSVCKMPANQEEIVERTPTTNLLAKSVKKGC